VFANLDNVLTTILSALQELTPQHAPQFPQPHE
jgi:hypothetical protein